MSDKKHIDRLFQEKFKDFEAIPSAAVWENIDAKLTQSKKKRRVIPIWWKIAGIAAILALLFTAGNFIVNSNDSSPQPTEVVNTESDSNSDVTNQDNSVITNNNKVDANSLSQDEITSDNITNQKNQITNKRPSAESDTATILSSQKKSSEENSVVANTKTNKTSNELNEIDDNSLISKEDTRNSLAQNENKDDKTSASIINKEKVDALLDATKKDGENALTNSNTEKETNVSKTENEEDVNKLSLTEAVEEQEETVIVDDVVEKSNRWGVMPNIAPVYYNSLGSGSSIDDQFVNNTRTGEINLSYGITGSYDLNNKLSLRAGINQVNVGYSTNDIVIYNNIEPFDNGNPLKNVKLNSSGQGLSFLSANGLSFAQLPSVLSDNVSSTIDQELGFIEIPVELEYKISDNKLGISIIGGFSTLFLNQNEIYSTLQGERTLLGEATNINKTSFSANLGLGVTYKISKKIDLNLEPVVKYQLNTFTNTSGNFNPYLIGIYSGLRFKF